MLRENKRLQDVVILLTAVLVYSQVEDDSIEFYFENNEGSTTYRSSCHNFTVTRQLMEVIISAFNKTEGFMQCFCSLRSTYEISNVTVRFLTKNKNTEYLLEDNSTIEFKLTFSDAITNGYLYVQGSELTSISTDGVNITADGVVLDMTCNNVSYPNFTINPLPPTTEPPSTEPMSTTLALSTQCVTATVALSTHMTSHSGSKEKLRTENANNNIPVIPMAAAIAGIVVIAAVVTGTVVYLRRRRKSVKEKEDQGEGIHYADISITSFAPRDPKVVAVEEKNARAKLEASSTAAITYVDVDFSSRHGFHNPSLYTEGVEYERVDAVKKQGRFNENTGDFSLCEMHETSPASGDSESRPRDLPVYAQVVKNVKKKKL